MKGRRSVLLFLLLSVAGCAAVEERKPAPPAPAERVREGNVEGALTPEGIAIPLEGIGIVSGDLKTSTDAAGTFYFRSLDRGKHSIVAEKRFETGEVRRVMGVAVVSVSDPAVPIRVKVALRDATFVDRFCEECHPYRGQPVREGQVLRDVHKSGIVPKKATKWPESRDEKGRITCLSCHTPHRKTEYGKFLVGVKTGPLCQKCH